MKFTRRDFLHSTLGAPLAASLGGIGRFRLLSVPTSLLLGDSAAAFDAARFPKPHAIRYDSQCFTIADRDTFLFSAAMHYPRCPSGLWRDRLEKLKRAGFNTIETYVFWNYHEPEEGRADLSEFEDYIKLVAEMGFWMITRPGPYVCAEWDAGGLPHWVIAKKFPLRSNDPESLRTSQHWFSLVLPVIQRHQVTNGGPIILMQLENEYDYWDLADDAKRDYITALAKMAWAAGIEIPLITCWTKQVRERGNPEIARVADFCNFYPRWNILAEVVPALAKLRKQESESPLGVVELQGGWFSEVGGKLSSEQEGIGAAQLNMLSKTVIERGATYFSYYMGLGGTNFDWAGKGMTTSYDYAAPLREPGGIWDKFFAARGIGESLKLFGNVLARSSAAESDAESNNGAVTVTMRRNGASGILFVRENSNENQPWRMSFRDLSSASGEMITVPRKGELMIHARGMKMLPVGLPMMKGQLLYTTAEVLAYGTSGRQYLILYDDPGCVVEFSLRSENESKIEGEIEYHSWEKERNAAVIGMRVGEAPKMLLFNGQLQVILLPRDLALRTWIANYPARVSVDERSNAQAHEVPFISDATLMWASGNSSNGVWAELAFPPGERDVVSLMPAKPVKCLVDSATADLSYEDSWQTARVHLKTPAIPAQATELKEVETWVERFDPAAGHWRNTALRPLEEMGPIPYGYVKYRSEFNYHGESKLAFSLFADDGAKIFVNGKFFAEAIAFGEKRRIEFELAGFANKGTNLLEIAYELFGSPNFGEHISELKGIESASLVRVDRTGTTGLSSWQVQVVPAAMRGREVDPDFPESGWLKAALNWKGTAAELVPSFTWCRAELAMDSQPDKWQIPWKVHLEADRDALLYLNGRFVGRFVVIGPQKEFFLPEPFLTFGSGAKNILTIVLAYCESAAPIRVLRVAPYEEFATRRTRVEFGW